jgi:prepilin-type N-terminal cleavage/methylation domain-containing protein
MAYRVDRERRGGFTLLEILIVLAIVGIVVMIAVSNFRGMMEKYRVEGETKQMFADLMDARGRAMQRNRTHFVQIAADNLVYKTYDDTKDVINATPDGDGVLQPGEDTLVVNATVRHTIHPGGLSNFRFNRNGIASATGTIWFTSTAQPDYDCITVRETRIKMGKWNGASCDEK